MEAIKNKSLGDYIVDRTESLDDKYIKEYFIDNNDGKISRLLDSEQYILEGSRGIGKTMLMKAAQIRARENFGQDSILTVWISFEESLRIERIKIIDSSIDPFLQWTMGKTLYELLKKLVDIKPECSDKLSERLSKIFNSSSLQSTTSSFDYYQKLLQDYILLLEKGDIDNNSALSTKSPSNELAKILDNPVSFKNFLISLIDNFSLSKIVLLFDEAAHVFSHSQQEKFFTLFKSLRHPTIACKAAVYPGITNYGKYFEKGEDAKELRINWMPNNPEDTNYIKNILKVRLQAYDKAYWNKLTINKEIIDTICICSNGNPRFSFHIIDELENSNAFKKTSITNQMVINSIRSVFDNKWKEFGTLQNRLIKYKSFIREAEMFIKDTIIPNLREWNNRRRESNKKLSTGFYIETGAYDEIPQIFDILAYHNIININYSKKSIGHGNYGYYVNLNPSIVFSDAIIRNTDEMRNISIAIENNQAYYKKTSQIQDLINKVRVDNEYLCSNEKCNFTTEKSYKFCPECGSPINLEEPQSLYKILRSHSIDNLKLGPRIIERLKAKFCSIGQIYDADIEELRMPYIQDVRIEKIKTAAIEYMAG
ncbi:hypothetical protein [Aneurinibacillus aneurinilyticus]|uniref:Uncharacterized protein n=1 Tax=Aneurinibacillus aneurinilyticus TaxID=1391 RepID=A0A848CN98_ANEAE|nr:hypothetical protein [Aneurinibacillus aneurinilyticus]NME98834.1 hypothetical protein [Aneurinibacillus aneurinilyticus]